MPRKISYHFIYRTTCIITNKYYIGLHSTPNIKDGYLGSGKKLYYSILKYGKTNHVCEILEYLKDRPSLLIREREIINREFLKNPMCMNIQLGGGGWNGFLNPEHQLKCSTAGGKSFSKRIKSDIILKNEYKIRFRNLIKKRKTSYAVFTNNSHSEESKRKIGLANSIKQMGTSNSQYGTCWINNTVTDKKIKKDELPVYLNIGWQTGRIKRILA